MNFSFSKENLINIVSYILLKNFPVIREKTIKIVRKNKIVNFYNQYSYNFFDLFLMRLFWGYYAMIANTKESRDLFYKICIDGPENGKDYAEFYYKQNNIFKLYKEKWFISNISYKEATPTFEITKNLINENLKKTLANDIYLIQIGSCSGRDIEYLNFHNPKINYISTDISDEILNFQKRKYNFKNVKYFKCFAENIDECIRHFGIEKKLLIIFANGSIHHITPYNIQKFFSKLSKYNNLIIVSLQTINKYFIKSTNKNQLYKVSKNFLFSYRYGAIANKYNFRVIEDRVIDIWKGSKFSSKATAKHLLVATKQIV